ncbi:MAG: hypothetical protein Q8N16_00705 [bacterium]|nr:hypothetical protein [bacterium]
MFIITIDFKGSLANGDTKKFLAGTRSAAFGAIPRKIQEANELDFNTDCIAVHVSLGPKTILGRILRLVTSGNFPDFLAAICFSAKPKYIPHDADLIAAIAMAAAEFMKSCGLLLPGTKAAAWAIPFVLGKWAAVST